MGKIKDYVKKHKDAVPYVIGAGAGLLLVALGMRAASKANSSCKNLDHPQLDEGDFNWYRRDRKGYHMGGMTEVPVSDLGKVGDAMKQCDGIDENSKISFMFTDYTEK